MMAPLMVKNVQVKWLITSWYTLQFSFGWSKLTVKKALQKFRPQCYKKEVHINKESHGLDIIKESKPLQVVLLLPLGLIEN